MPGVCLDGPNCPEIYRSWIDSGKIDPLQSEPTLTYRKKRIVLVLSFFYCFVRMSCYIEDKKLAYFKL